MKTSLGIWAFGPMVTRFVPGGYQPQWRDEPIPEKVHRAVGGLGDLIDDYEFHYPGELNRDNLDDVRAALDGHGIYCIAGGLHVDPRFGKGGLTSLDDSVRARGAAAVARGRRPRRRARRADDRLARAARATTTRSRCRTPRCGRGCSTASAQVAERLASHGRLLFLEHKNSEPAMKIHMSNIGMTLHVISKLRERGIDNVKVNMDWQHLIMNGENLGEYAALLAAEGLLGHQHANSGWGTFDDDNMVGATAFMETLELALELRRANYGANGERLGFDLYPYTEDQVAAVRRSVLQWRFIDERRVADRRGGAARGAVAQGRGARVRDRVRGARRVIVGLDVGTTARQGDRDRRRRRRARARGGVVRAVDAAARAGPSRIRTTGCARPSVRCRALDATAVGFSGQMHGLVALGADDAPLRPAILWNDQRTGAECAEIERRIGLERLIELTGNRALTGLHRAEAPVAPRARAGGLRAHPLDPAAEGLRAAEALRRARDRRRRRVGDAAVRRRAAPLERRGARRARAPAASGCRRCTSRRRSRAPATRRPARSASASPGPGRSRSCSARRASSSACSSGTRPTPRRACTSSATRFPARGTRWA